LFGNLNVATSTLEYTLLTVLTDQLQHRGHDGLDMLFWRRTWIECRIFV